MQSQDSEALQARYRLACELAKAGAELAFEYYQQREALTVDHKGDDLQDVVSVADKRGHGAWLNDAPIRPHPATTVKEGVMGVGTSHRVTPADFLPFLQALLSDGGMFIRNGSGALMSAWAAAGRLIGYYEPHMNPWDALPGLVLMREAGGASNDFLAQEGIQRGNPLLLASPTLYPQLKKMIPQPLH